jgi:hypothetical protein
VRIAIGWLGLGIGRRLRRLLHRKLTTWTTQCSVSRRCSSNYKNPHTLRCPFGERIFSKSSVRAVCRVPKDTMGCAQPSQLKCVSAIERKKGESAYRSLRDG